MERIAFALFAAVALGGGLVALFHRSIVHSAFALMATFLGVSGLFVLLGADFLAVVQLLIYVGGILVLILFGLMLTRPDPAERKVRRVAFVLTAVAVPAALLVGKIAAAGRWAAEEGKLPEPQPAARELGLLFLLKDAYLIPFELAAFLLTVALVGAVYLARQTPPPPPPEEPR
ncbi:MAG TPA: NADH-quinone oxidoreductase subunit J [Planctomycetota bacterium]|jgi:NADH-quinone oxidoreductase subunit J|nr:NADH-quinone oxidoreductase subunit J [Planctomycetota bacterium]